MTPLVLKAKGRRFIYMDSEERIICFELVGRNLLRLIAHLEQFYPRKSRPSQFESIASCKVCLQLSHETTFTSLADWVNERLSED